MAGSYRHVVDEDGSFIGTDLLSDLEDAHEALEEMYLMIQYLTGGDKAKIHEAWQKGYFEKNCPPCNADMATYERFWREY